MRAEGHCCVDLSSVQRPLEHVDVAALSGYAVTLSHLILALKRVYAESTRAIALKGAHSSFSPSRSTTLRASRRSGSRLRSCSFTNGMTGASGAE